MPRVRDPRDRRLRQKDRAPAATHCNAKADRRRHIAPFLARHARAPDAAARRHKRAADLLVPGRGGGVGEARRHGRDRQPPGTREDAPATWSGNAHTGNWIPRRIGPGCPSGSMEATTCRRRRPSGSAGAARLHSSGGEMRLARNEAKPSPGTPPAALPRSSPEPLAAPASRPPPP